MARLETILEAQLFHRTTRKLELTEEGRHLMRYAQSIVDLSREAAESMKGLVKEEKGIYPYHGPQLSGGLVCTTFTFDLAGEISGHQSGA